ncbi:MAG: hypothetical protein ACRENY_00930 [Candidatus Dormibacteria bacterium]
MTDAASASLIEMARLLAVPAAAALAIFQSSKPNQRSAPISEAVLGAGDRVAFTGEMEHDWDRLEELARSACLGVVTSVSGKTALVVVADPHSQSAKARYREARIVTQ